MDSQTITRILLIIIVALLLCVVVIYYMRNKSALERFSMGAPTTTSASTSSKTTAAVAASASAAAPPTAPTTTAAAAAAAAPFGSGVPVGAPYAIPNYGDLVPSSAVGQRVGFELAGMGGAPIGGIDGMGSGSAVARGSAPPIRELPQAEMGAGDPSGIVPAPWEPRRDANYGLVDTNPQQQTDGGRKCDGTGGACDSFPGNASMNIEDLLPKDAANSKWAQVNPAGQGQVGDQNFLTAGYLNGIDTQGSSMRNPNLQLRSELPNPRFNVGPWNQSTIEPNLGHRYFELGEA